MNDGAAHLIKPSAELADEFVYSPIGLFIEPFQAEAARRLTRAAELWHVIVEVCISEAIIRYCCLEHQVSVCLPVCSKLILGRECKASQEYQLLIAVHVRKEESRYTFTGPARC